MLDYRRDVGGVVVHVVTVGYLCRAAMAAPIVGDNAIALIDEIEHLRIPVVGAEGPAMMEDDRLGVLRAPVLEVDFRAVFGRDGAHDHGSFARGKGWNDCVRLRRLRRRQGGRSGGG